MAVAHSQYLSIKAKIRHLKIIVQRTSFRKGWNLTKLFLSYWLSYGLKKPVVWGKPFSVGVEPTTACNLRCPQCISGLRAFTRPQGRMSLETFRKLIHDIHSHVNVVQFFFQGEPFLNPRLPEFIQIASRYNLYSIISTNGHFLTPERIDHLLEAELDHIIISVDGLTQATYEKYRVNGNLSTVVQGIRELVKRRGTRIRPLIELQFIVFKHNELEVPYVLPFSKEIGVDRVTIKSAQVYTEPKKWLPKAKKYRRYHEDGQLKIPLPNRCWKMWHSFEVTWDGNIIPCCFDKDAHYRFGNIHSESFHSIWKGEKYQMFRHQLLQSRGAIEICRNCSEGL